MTRKRKAFSVVLRVFSCLSYVVFPAGVVYTKFPLWKEQGGSGVAIGSGAIILLAIAFLTFKKHITAFAAEKLGTMSAGVSLLLLWSTATLVCFLLARLTTILNDLSTVFLWSAIGAAAGLGFHGTAKLIVRDLKSKIKEDSNVESD